MTTSIQLIQKIRNELIGKRFRSKNAIEVRGVPFYCVSSPIQNTEIPYGSHFKLLFCFDVALSGSQVKKHLETLRSICVRYDVRISKVESGPKIKNGSDIVDNVFRNLALIHFQPI